MPYLKVLGVFCILLQCVHSANVLGVFPLPSKSHDILGYALLRHLARIGHNVTYISCFSHKTEKNFYHIHFKESKQYQEELMEAYTHGNTIGLALQAFKVGDLIDRFFENEFVRQLVQSDSRFDVLIHFMGIDATLALGDRFDVPIIVFTPVGGFTTLDQITGNPVPASYVPNIFLPFGDDMKLLERTANAIVSYGVFPFLDTVTKYIANKCVRKHLPGAPSMQEISQRIELILVNTHICTETPRPYVPNMIQIGGFHLQEPERLPEHLRRVLDAAKDGFAYLSFGTNVNLKEQPENVLDVFKKVLGKLPLKVIMKYEDDTMPNQPNNFYLSKWFPQPSVLAHSNAKVFISHGGYGGCIESLYYGVPMVCIPFVGDHPRNCANAQQNGYSITVTLNELNENTFSHALQKVLYDQKFKDAARLKSELYRDQPMNPMDKAVYWIEHVIKHKGAKHLKVKGAELPWYQYHLLDVFILIGSVSIIFISMIIYTCRFMCRKLKAPRNKMKMN